MFSECFRLLLFIKQDEWAITTGAICEVKKIEELRRHLCLKENFIPDIMEHFVGKK
jgi:hypothetical protein